MKKLIKVIAALFFVSAILFCYPIFTSRTEVFRTIQGGRQASGEEEFIQQVYNEMLTGAEKIQISYTGNDYALIHERFFDEILPKVFLIDDPETSDDFDYMRYNLEEIRINTKSNLFGEIKIVIEPKWKESKEETNKVNVMIQEILDELILPTDSEEEKVKKIHDFIVNRLEYDQTLKNMTAYQALVDGKAICQSYMLLTYKMMTEAGIKIKCVDGIAVNEDGEQPHGWNLIFLSNKWYHLDATWDDPVYIGGEDENARNNMVSYDYYLKGNFSFLQDHTFAKEFQNSQFEKEYPVSKEDY